MKVRNENYTNLNLEEILFKINKVIALINKANTLMASIFVTCILIFILLCLQFVRFLLFLLL